MSHIHTKPNQYDQTVSAFIVKLDKEPKIILHIHKYMKTFFHFGGHIELDENPWQCLVREIREESGYDISQLKILQPETSLKALSELDDTLIHPVPFMLATYHYEELAHFHSDLKYVFTTKEEPKYRPEDGESDIIESFSREEILKLPEDKIQQRDKKLCLYVFDVLLKKWKPVNPNLFKTS